MKIRKILNFQRPKDIPDFWEIYNAPRPLYGNRCWQGEFISGVFYAAINPYSTEADMWRENNKNLDAVRLEFVTRQSVIDEMIRYYHQKYSSERVEKIFKQHPLKEKETQEMLIQTWFNLEMNWKEIEDEN